jgi:peptide/nickel transport system substrate-binding protein
MTVRRLVQGRRMLRAIVALGLVGGAIVYAQPDRSMLVVGQLQFLKNFHPLIQVNNTKRLQTGYGLLPITAFDEHAANQCVLCETLPTFENGMVRIVDRPDGSRGMRVMIRLRRGLRWGDGHPVTPHDIVFTHRLAMDRKVGFSNYNPWTRAKSVRPVDGRTVVLELDKVVPSYASWDQILPSHLEEPIFNRHAEASGYLRNTLYNTNPTHPGLWNGPFKLTRYQIGTRLVYEPNPFWPGTKPQLRKVVLAFLDNSSALLLNLLAGEIDAVPVSPGGISFSQMLDVRRLRPHALSYAIEDGTNLERLAVNFDNPILANRDVRRAMLMGINRGAITQVLFAGQQKVANGILSDNHPFFNPHITRYAYNPQAARALLRRAGWSPGRDGICTDRQGRRLSLELATTAGNQTREQMALLIQNQLKRVCIEITNKFVPLQEFNGNLARKRRFSGLMLSSIDFSPSASPRIALGSGSVPSAANLYVGNNFSGYRSATMDAALARFDRSLTPQEVHDAWNGVQQLFSDDLPMLPLYFYARAYVHTPDLHHFRQATYDPLVIWANEWSRR